MEIPTRNVIFLQGVFFKDIRTLEDHMMENSSCPTDVSNQEFKPALCDSVRVTKFKSTKQWADTYKNMSIKCWYCGLNFKGLPCFIPRQIRTTAKGKEYDTQGLFCGFACAFAFLKNSAEFLRDKTYFDRLAMLKMLFVQFYNKRPLEFREAPCIYDMTLYGGHRDIMDYRTELKNINMSMITNAQFIHN